ncbi:MAG: DUF1015 domain-containing protein [Candidatus Omnitrophica bacterium]|jgi:uncharacterized protein (DUF1015 family)|nr:DUF1015 domain-containing protein [Candidatus Omnitrophota bacterium]
MAKIKPFSALVYNQNKVADLSRVTCPPYDVISQKQQEFYHKQSPYNLIHLLLGKDIPDDDKYARAGRMFQDWIKQDILTKDAKPAIYFYSQEYNILGEKKTRFGFISLLELEDKSSPVFKHEYTRCEPKEDRFKLLSKVHANLSPIFAIFPDKKRVIRQVFSSYIKNLPCSMQVVDPDSVKHKIWRVDEPELLKSIQSKMQDEEIFIADGHHRYEVACLYREHMRKKLGSLDGAEGFNYLMTYFTNTDARGLSILPIHRFVHLPSGFNFESFKELLRENFDVEEVKDSARFTFLMQKAAMNEQVIGMYIDKKFWLLRLKNIKILDKVIADKPKEYRRLGVCIFNYLVLNKALGMDIEDKSKIIFHHDAQELMRKLDKEPGGIVFILNPAKMEEIINVALRGERMPSKSTYFYPKVLSGLVINKF